MGKRQQPKGWSGAGRWAGGVLVVAALHGTAALAQTAAPGAALPHSPAATGPDASSSAVRFAIPAGSLSAVLAAFGETTGLQILYPASLAQGVTSPGVTGRYSPQQALQIVLARTGLAYRFTNARTVTIEKQPAAGADSLSLPPVVVQGQQNAADSGPGYIAPQSVAGTKTDTPILQTPQSISVVPRAQIETQNPQTVDQALRYTAAVQAESRGGFTGFDFVYGRGFVLDQYLNGLKLQGAAAYISPSIDIYNIERIEVLRGPASVLYGQASPGGLLNIVNKMPPDQPFHEIMLQGGTFNNFAGGFDLGGPLDQDGHFLYRLTGVARTGDSQVDDAKSRRFSISPSLTWKPDGDTKFTLLLNYQRDPWVGLYNFVPATGTILHNPNGKLPTSFYAGDPNYNKIDRTQYSAGYQLEHRFSDVWTVRQNFRYMHVDGNLNQVLPIFMADDRTMARYALRDNDNLDAITIDNQAQANFTTGPLFHKLLLGVDYQKTWFDERLGQDYAPDLDIFAPVYHQPIPSPALISKFHQNSNQFGVYAQDQIQLGGLTMLLGGRQDWAGSRSNDKLVPGSAARQNDSEFTYRLGLLYLFDNGLAPYASYTTSFQPQAGADSGGNPFKPTTAQQYEIGVKYQPPGFNSFITLSAYHLTQQNVPTTDSADPSFQIQTGEIRTRGIEIEGHFNLAPGFNVIASYGYADPEVTKSTPAAGDLGKVPLNVPKHFASLWTDYTFQDGPFAGLGIGGGVRFIGKTFGDPQNTLKVPSYTLFDAALTYDLAGLSSQFEGWRLTVNASNLLDKKYISECSNDSYCLYGTRRTVLANIRYRW